MATKCREILGRRMSWWRCPKMIMARHFQLHDWKKLLNNCCLIRLNTWTRSEQNIAIMSTYMLDMLCLNHGLLYKNAILKNACNYFPMFHNWSKETLRLMWKGNCLNTWHTCQTWIQPIPQRHFINSRGWTICIYIYAQTYTNAMCYIYISLYIICLYASAQ